MSPVAHLLRIVAHRPPREVGAAYRESVTGTVTVADRKSILSHTHRGSRRRSRPAALGAPLAWVRMRCLHRHREARMEWSAYVAQHYKSHLDRFLRELGDPFL